MAPAMVGGVKTTARDVRFKEAANGYWYCEVV
jgi:hypothetical protein